MEALQLVIVHFGAPEDYTSKLPSRSEWGWEGWLVCPSALGGSLKQQPFRLHLQIRCGCRFLYASPHHTVTNHRIVAQSGSSVVLVGQFGEPERIRTWDTYLLGLPCLVRHKYCAAAAVALRWLFEALKYTCAMKNVCLDSVQRPFQFHLVGFHGSIKGWLGALNKWFNDEMVRTRHYCSGCSWSGTLMMVCLFIRIGVRISQHSRKYHTEKYCKPIGRSSQ